MFSSSQNRALTTIPVASSSQQQCELRSVFPKPSVVAPVNLNQLPSRGDPQAALCASVADVCVGCSHRHSPVGDAVCSRYVYAFAFTQQLTHMSVVGSRIPCARQMPQGLRCLRYRVGRSTTSMVGECGRSFCQYAANLRRVWRMLTPISVDACSIVICSASKLLST